VPGDGRAGTSIGAADMTCGNGCFGFRWWEWRTKFFRAEPCGTQDCERGDG
jgi:hypothetical protein